MLTKEKRELRELFEKVWLDSCWTHETEYVSAQRKQKTGASIIKRADNGNYVMTVRSDLAPLVASAPRTLRALKFLVSTLDEDACTCAVRSWFGAGHDTACPLNYLEEAEAAIAEAEGRKPC